MLALLRPGLMLDRYELIEAVGRGAMGEVWRARHTFTGADCAIKLLHPGLASHEELARLFVQEAQVGARLNRHPNIVRVQDAGQDPETGIAFLVMELLEGETLEDWRGRDGPLPWPLAKLVLEQLGDAVQSAHDAGIVHRDLKPGNLFLANDHRGEPLLKILDFGIARVLEEGVVRTATQIGTPAYAAPEQLGPTFQRMALAQGVTIVRDISSATDVWSLGLVAYDLLTGAEPGSFFGVETVSELPVKIALEPAPVPSDRAGAAAGRLPPGFDEWFALCVDRDARRRHPTFRGAATALAELLAQPQDPSLSVRFFDVAGPELDEALAAQPLEPSLPPPSALVQTLPEGQEPAEQRPAEAVTPGEPEASIQLRLDAASLDSHPEMETERHRVIDTRPTIVSRKRRVSRARGPMPGLLMVVLALIVAGVLWVHPWKPTHGTLAVVVAGPNNKAIDAVEVSIESGGGKVERACRASPCTATKLLPGAYLLRVKAPGYEMPAAEAARVEPGSNLVKRIELSPARKIAGLRVSTRAAGSFHLVVDGRDQGLLPAKVHDLAPGEHTLRIVDEGRRYQHYEQKVSLGNGEVLELNPALRLVRGVARVIGGENAEGARVALISGKERRDIARLPATLELDLTRPNTLVAWKKGYRDFELELSWADTEPEKSFEIVMAKAQGFARRADSASAARGAAVPPSSAAAGAAPPSPAAASAGTILINSIPISDATVDGQRLGTTPTRWSGPPGTHAVLFVHPEHGRKVISVVVEPGGTAVAAVRFP